MGIPVGMDQKSFARIESAFDTVSRFVATDAVPLLELVLEPSQDYQRSMERLGTGGLVEEIKGISGGRWSAKAYVKPNAAGTAPDIGDIIKAAMGATATVADTSTTYAFNSLDPISLQLGRGVGTSQIDLINGAVVEEWSLDVSGNKPPEFSFSGAFASYGWLYGNPVTTAIVTAGASTLVVTAANRGKVGVGACLNIGSDTNSGLGYLITAYNPSTGQATFAPTLGVEQAAGAALTPCYPSQTLGGVIVGGTGCGLSLDGGSTWIGMLSGKITCKTGFHLLDKEATATKATRAARGKREVTIEATCYFLEETAGHAGRGLDGLRAGYAAGDANVFMRFGPDVTGQRLKVIAGKSRIGAAPVNLPEDEATFDLKFFPRKNASTDDEMSFMLD